MLRSLAAIGIFASALTAPTCAQAKVAHYLFVWTGDQKKVGKDFLAVIDADPASPTYGHLVTSIATDQVSVRPHHTEYQMPADGMLFANDFDAGRTFVFDLKDPTHPKVSAEFADRDGYAYPHSFVRLPNHHVLATFQYKSGAMPRDGDIMDGAAERSGTITGGLVEMAASSRSARVCFRPKTDTRSGQDTRGRPIGPRSRRPCPRGIP